MSQEKCQYETGERPPDGIYVCMSCTDNPETIIIPDMAKALPKCPRCGWTYWYKV